MKTKTRKLETINLLSDAMFKGLFRSIEAREMVATFLSHITGIDEELLKNADYQGGEIPKKRLYEKGKVADIIIKIENHNMIILEMNQYPTDTIFDKNASYAFSVLSESIPIRTGKYPFIFLINLDNFNRFHTKEAILHFLLRDEEGHIETKIYQSYHLILENIVNKKYNKDEVIKKTVELLLKKTIEEMEEAYRGDEMYMAAIRRVEDLSRDPRFVGYYDIEEANRQARIEFEETGFRRGKEIGHELGMKEGHEIGVKEGHELGIKETIEKISKQTGYTEEEIRKMLR